MLIHLRRPGLHANLWGADGHKYGSSFSKLLYVGGTCSLETILAAVCEVEPSAVSLDQPSRAALMEKARSTVIQACTPTLRTLIADVSDTGFGKTGFGKVGSYFQGWRLAALKALNAFESSSIFFVMN